MQGNRRTWRSCATLVVALLLASAGCYNTPIDTSELAQGPAPRRIPSPAREAEAHKSYEDSLTGGQIFAMYCSYCHNSPTLAERPFASFRNVATHMRVRANLTGKEYARLMEFLRRWNDVPPPNPPLQPGPTRFTFSQPISELRPATDKAAPKAAAAVPPQGQPAAGATAVPPVQADAAVGVEGNR
jgi:hypothetical protein